MPIENGQKRQGRGRSSACWRCRSTWANSMCWRSSLPPGHEVVLIDLRESTIDGETRRGLVLHHQSEEVVREGQPPPWVGSELLARIDKLLASRQAGKRPEAAAC